MFEKANSRRYVFGSKMYYVKYIIGEWDQAACSRSIKQNYILAEVLQQRFRIHQ